MIKRSTACLLAVVLSLAFFAPCTALAASTPIRVGYFDCGDYYQPQADGSIVSYDAAYLEAVSEYSGMGFTYVDCGTWENAMQMLGNHEIDLLGTMQKDDARTERFTICNGSYGIAAVELAALPDSSIGYEDYSAIDDSRLGLLKDYVRQPEIDKLLLEHSITPESSYYDTQEKLFAALESGSVDLIAAGSHTLPSDWKVIEKFSYQNIYFASWKGNEQLIGQMDKAIIDIKLHQPMLQADLQTRFFPGLMLEPYSVAELVYIESLPAINVYINDNSQPLTYRDEDNNMIGILVELCDLIKAETGLKFNYCALASKNEPEGQTSITINCPDSSVAEQAFVSDSFFTTSFNVYCRTEQAFGIDPNGAYRIVLPQNRQSFIDYLELTYPNCEIVKLDTPEQCIREVSTGSADLTMLSNYLVDNICKRKEIQNITSVPEQGISLGFVMISEGPDAEGLTGIINKGIARIDRQEASRIQFSYALNTKPDMTLSYFVKNNAVLVIVIAVLLATAICALIYVRLLTKKNAAIEKANNAKSDFLSTMSHDIRTPMNAIINIAKLAQDDYIGNGGGNVLEDLRQIETVSDYLMGLLNDVLDMSSIEQGKLQLHPEVYDYSDFLHYINSVFKPLCNDKKISFVCEPGSTSLPIYVDKVRFNQLFSNLLSNAVKYTPEGGTITYRVKDNDVSGGLLRCKFEVSDNGCGMSEEFQARMFEPFEREEATRSTNQGTGLGLTIAKNIVTLMGGEISVKSKLGEGTSFVISLAIPIATEKQKNASLQKAKPVDSIAGKRILVVEDNETNIIVLTRFLAKKDVVTTVARDGKEAVEAFALSAPWSFDMVLMDLRMPVMDGYEATQIIRAMDRPDAKEIPILAMTADAFDNDVEATKAAGMNAHLTKPVVAETLYRIVGQFCK